MNHTMKILFWQWNAFMQRGMENALKKLNIEYDVIKIIPTDWEKDEVLSASLSDKLSQIHYDLVLSVNYCPVVSDICDKFNVTYISWVYDSPIHIRDISSFANKCNRIYFFDRGQMQYYRKQGFDNVFHMPLAADADVWKGALNCSANERRRLSCDVAFVGQLYDSEYNYLMGPLPLYERGQMEGIINAQGLLYGAYILDEMLDDARMERLNGYYAKASDKKVQISKAEMEYALACEVTGRERKIALSLLAGRCNLHIHSSSDCSFILNAGGTQNQSAGQAAGDRQAAGGVQSGKAEQAAGQPVGGVQIMGYADYYTKMPAVFANAAINLNISLKTIRTGIPLRVLDIMSCGGFVISNYQEELLEYFKPGYDIVIYEDTKDLVRKVMYYLGHEKERSLIAQNGCRRVKEAFTFDGKLGQMLDSHDRLT